MSPTEKTVLLTPIFSKINCIDQKVKKKHGQATDTDGNFGGYFKILTLLNNLQSR
jgi:hypothetical protein